MGMFGAPLLDVCINHLKAREKHREEEVYKKKEQEKLFKKE